MKKITNYYCVVKRINSDDYEFVFKQNTTALNVRKELIAEGYKVFHTLSPKALRILKSHINFASYVRDGRESFDVPFEEFKFMQNIQLLPEDNTGIHIIKYYDRSFRMWSAYLQDDNQNRLTAIEFRQTKDEINALHKGDFRSKTT